VCGQRERENKLSNFFLYLKVKFIFSCVVVENGKIKKFVVGNKDEFLFEITKNEKESVNIPFAYTKTIRIISSNCVYTLKQ